MTKKATTTQKKSASARKRKQQAVEEPIAARALQLLILVLGVMLLFSVLFGPKFGPAMVGILVLASAFPPARRHVDKWLVGKTRGEEANQAAVLRMGAGFVIVLLAVTGLLPF